MAASEKKVSSQAERLKRLMKETTAIQTKFDEYLFNLAARAKALYALSKSEKKCAPD